MALAQVVREFPALANGTEIVAGTYLQDNMKIAFVDRLNSNLIIVNRTNNESICLPLVTRVVGAAKPSDINKGILEGTLIVTFTDNNPQQGSKVIHYGLDNNNLREEWSLNFKDRTRSTAVLDDDHVVATFQWSVCVFNRWNGSEVAEIPRQKRDKGGLITANRSNGMFYYGDGHEIVGCQFNRNSGSIRCVSRYNAPDVKFPRGSALLNNGDLLVGCDESRRIVRISSDFSCHTVVVTGQFGFGDVDYNPVSGELVATRWPKTQHEKPTPVIYRLQ